MLRRPSRLTRIAVLIWWPLTGSAAMRGRSGRFYARFAGVTWPLTRVGVRNAGRCCNAVSLYSMWGGSSPGSRYILPPVHTVHIGASGRVDGVARASLTCPAFRSVGQYAATTAADARIRKPGPAGSPGVQQRGVDVIELLLVGIVGLCMGALVAWLDLCAEIGALKRENRQLCAYIRARLK